MSTQPQVDVFEDLVENALIDYFNADAVTKDCRPDHWDTDRKYVQPSLFIKCELGEQLIPANPVYAVHCVVTLDGKPKRFSYAAAWKAVRKAIEAQGLNDALTNPFVRIGSNAEDVSSSKSIAGDTRKRTVTFTLRGFAKI